MAAECGKPVLDVIKVNLHETVVNKEDDVEDALQASRRTEELREAAAHTIDTEHFHCIVEAHAVSCEPQPARRPTQPETSIKNTAS